MLIQALGLLVGTGFIALFGTAADTATLIVAMIGLGACKGFYDSGIFASLYDVVELRARASAAGVMNTIGWAGGFLGTLAFGAFAEHGRYTSEVENMSEALTWGSLVYLASGVILIAAAVVYSRSNVSINAMRTSDGH
jgi:hypothetical protein